MTTSGSRLTGDTSLVPRIATSVVLIPIMLGAIFLLPTPQFALLMLAVMGLGAWEWAGLSGFDGRHQRLGYALGLAALLWLLLLAGAVRGGGAIAPGLLWLSLVLWCLVLVWVVRYPRLPPGLRHRWLALLVGSLILGPCWVSLSLLHEGIDGIGAWRVLSLFILIWCADSAAYFAGRRWGRHKLAPLVSPGKSWEGVLGAALAVLLVAPVLAWRLGLAPAEWPLFALLALTTVSFSILGDLWESVTKRVRGVKDSGTLLPGHGGVLDRIDSLTAAAPVFALGLLWWGKLGI